jgi:hypothetical protein
VLAPIVYRRVAQACPQNLYKFLPFKGEWKQMRKDLAKNKVDLSSVEAGMSESTVVAYVTWACSAAAPRIIKKLPAISEIQFSTNPGGTVDIDESSVSLDDKIDSISQIEAEVYDNDPHTYLSSNHFYAGFFFFGLVLGGFVVQCYHFHSIGEKVVNKGLRRPEL